MPERVIKMFFGHGQYRRKIFLKSVQIATLSLFVFQLPSTQVYAQNWELVCRQPDQDCEFTDLTQAKFFNESNLVPGQVVQRQFSVSNQTKGNCFLELQAQPTHQAQEPNLAAVINTYIYSNDKTWFGEAPEAQRAATRTLTDLFAAGLIKLGKVKAHEEKHYTWLAIIDKWQTDNSWQGTETVFDISFYIECLSKEDEREQLNGLSAKKMESTISLDEAEIEVGIEPVVAQPQAKTDKLNLDKETAEVVQDDVLIDVNQRRATPNDFLATSAARSQGQVKGEATVKKWWEEIVWWPYFVLGSDGVVVAVWLFWLKKAA